MPLAYAQYFDKTWHWVKLLAYRNWPPTDSKETAGAPIINVQDIFQVFQGSGIEKMDLGSQPSNVGLKR